MLFGDRIMLEERSIKMVLIRGVLGPSHANETHHMALLVDTLYSISTLF